MESGSRNFLHQLKQRARHWRSYRSYPSYSYNEEDVLFPDFRYIPTEPAKKKMKGVKWRIGDIAGKLVVFSFREAGTIWLRG